MANKSLSYWLGIVGLLICLPVGACNCNNSGPEAVDRDQKDAPNDDKAQAQAKPTKDEKAEYPDDLYPGFNFGVLEDKEKERFVGIAKAELCPCPGSAESLHDCLQKIETRCPLAQQGATIVAMGIKEKGLSSTDIMDKLAEFIANTKKAYQFKLENAPMKGNAEAKLVIVEFADFECPFCGKSAKIFKNLARRYETKIAFYYKHFPLSGHQYSELAARAAVAAQNQDRFWPMHDLLFDNQKSLSPDKVVQLAASIGLNMQKFKADLDSPEIAAKVSSDRQEGVDANLSGTPTIYFNGVRYMGDRDEASIAKAIDAALEQLEKETTN